MLSNIIARISRNVGHVSCGVDGWGFRFAPIPLENALENGSLAARRPAFSAVLFSSAVLNLFGKGA